MVTSKKKRADQGDGMGCGVHLLYSDNLRLSEHNRPTVRDKQPEESTCEAILRPELLQGKWDSTDKVQIFYIKTDKPDEFVDKRGI